MSREEKRRKFNEAVVDMLYPPPQIVRTNNEDLELNNYDSETIPGDFGNTGSSASSDDVDNDDGEDCESESRKLTRAQRKRLRRKKLKIGSSRRRQIIGPLLPPTEEVHNAAVENESPTVRQNAAEKPPEESGEPSASATKSKMKQRRKAKRLGRESKNKKFDHDHDHDHDQSLDLKPSNQDNCDWD